MLDPAMKEIHEISAIRLKNKAKASKFSATPKLQLGSQKKYVDLDKVDPDDKSDAKGDIKDLSKQISDAQVKLLANKQWSLLVVFQGIDTAGKSSAIRHVFDGVDPQGLQVYHFGLPSKEDLNHDFLWRAYQHLPSKGKIGIFDRSYYEDVLAVRTDTELLKDQNIPEELMTPNIWNQRFEDINNFEKHLIRSGTAICKFFLHISKDEQHKRLIERLDKPDKNWKFSPNDLQNSEVWEPFQKSAEEMLYKTSTAYAPWWIIPSNDKESGRLVIANYVLKTLNRIVDPLPKLNQTDIAAFKAVLNTQYTEGDD